jgi:hypothetical protein
MVGALVVTVNERVRRFYQGVQGDKELTMGDLTAELAPEHLHRVEPRAIGGPGQQHQPPRRSTDDRFDLILTMGAGILPGAIDGAGGMFVDQGLPQLGDLTTTFAAPEQHNGFTRIVVDSAQAIPFIRLTGGGHHHVLALRAPHGAEGWQPTHVTFVGVIKDLACGQLAASRFSGAPWPQARAQGRQSVGP